MGLKNDLRKGVKYLINSRRKVYVNPAMTNLEDLYKNKVVLITGGGSGIGLEMARRFSLAGAKVIITGRNEEKLKKAVSTLSNTIYFQNDIQNISKQDELINFVFKKYEKINVLINNAGISKHEKDFLSVTEQDFDDQFNTNLKGSYFLTQKIIKRLNNEEKKDFTVLFISSERGNQCDFLPYGLTKVAINSLVGGLSCRFIEEGIRVNGIAPGVTSSDMVKIAKNGNLATNQYISGRYFRPEEVAEVALFLASDLAKCISGEIIHTNNGNHLRPYFK